MPICKILLNEQICNAFLEFYLAAKRLVRIGDMVSINDWGWLLQDETSTRHPALANLQSLVCTLTENIIQYGGSCK